MSGSLQAEGLCLRFPENLPPHATLSHDVALQMLGRAISLATQIAFQPSYIDKPPGAISPQLGRDPRLIFCYRWPNLSSLYPRWRQFPTRWYPVYGARATIHHPSPGRTRT